MDNRTLSYLPGILLGAVLAAVGIVLHWSSIATMGVVVVVMVVGWLIYVLTAMLRFAWLRRFNRLVRRLKAGEANTVIAELTARQAAGDLSFEEMLALASAYNYVGRAADAEPLVQEAQSLLDQTATAAKKDMSSRAKCDLLLLAQYDSRLAQGQFAEAGHSLRQRVTQAVQPNFMTAIIAWAFFLAGDSYNASVVLGHIQPATTGRNNRRAISLKYQFMVAYMQHKLLGEDTRPDLVRRSDQFTDWEDEAARNAANPYGARVSQILDDIRPLLI